MAARKYRCAICNHLYEIPLMKETHVGLPKVHLCPNCGRTRDDSIIEFKAKKEKLKIRNVRRKPGKSWAGKKTIQSHPPDQDAKSEDEKQDADPVSKDEDDKNQDPNS